MSALAPAHTTRASHARDLVSDSLALAGRNLAARPPDPREAARRDAAADHVRAAVRATSSAASSHVPGGNYREYLIGGMLVQTLAFGMMGPGDLDRHRPHRGHGRPPPLAADGALGLPRRPLARRAGRRDARRDRALPDRPGRRLAHPHRASRTRSPASACSCSSPSRCSSLGTLLGAARALARCRPGRRVHDGLPADVPRQHVRAVDGLPTVLREFAAWNPISAFAAALRTLFGNPIAMPADPAVAAPAPGAELAALVRRAARGRDAVDALALPLAHDGLSRREPGLMPRLPLRLRLRTRSHPRSRGAA